MLKKVIVPIAFAALSTAAYADTKLGLMYIPSAEAEAPGAEIDGDGYGVYGRHDVNSNVFITAEFTSVTYDEQSGSSADPDIDFDQIRVAIGVNRPLVGSTLNTVLEAEVVNFDLADESEAGAGLHAGLAYQPLTALTIHGRVGYLWVDDIEGPEFKVGVDYKFAPQFSAFVDYRGSRFSDDSSGSSFDLDVDDVRLGIAAHF